MQMDPIGTDRILAKLPGSNPEVFVLLQPSLPRQYWFPTYLTDDSNGRQHTHVGRWVGLGHLGRHPYLLSRYVGT